jgi:hypothetical protein
MPVYILLHLFFIYFGIALLLWGAYYILCGFIEVGEFLTRLVTIIFSSSTATHGINHKLYIVMQALSCHRSEKSLSSKLISNAILNIHFPLTVLILFLVKIHSHIILPSTSGPSCIIFPLASRAKILYSLHFWYPIHITMVWNLNMTTVTAENYSCGLTDLYLILRPYQQLRR